MLKIATIISKCRINKLNTYASDNTSISLGGSKTLKHIDWQGLTVGSGSTTLTAQAEKVIF